MKIFPIPPNNTPTIINYTPIPSNNTPIPPNNTPIHYYNIPYEFILSDKPTPQLITGIALALYKLTYQQNKKLSFYHKIFDEKKSPISSINNLVKINKKNIFDTLIIFINHINHILSLTTAEIVTAYLYFEQIIYIYGFKNISIKSLRPLFITCISIASRTLDDINLTAKDITNILIDNNYTINSNQLVNMENFVLKTLDYRLNYSTSFYINYLNALIYNVDQNAFIPDLGIQ